MFDRIEPNRPMDCAQARQMAWSRSAR
eukprot:SAG25_NODE_10137_length_345_cov_0.565041_1_plen_26_part_01